MSATRKKKPKKALPALFVGSSVEGLDVAYAIQENLQHDAESTVWPQGIFEPSKSALQSLRRAIEKSDFAVFVFTPDDRVKVRGRSYPAIRDNVLFELGLFFGRLGPSRAFAVLPEGVDLKLPTDLLGITLGSYKKDRKDRNLVAALGPFSNQVRRAIKKQGPIRKARRRQSIPSTLRGISIHRAEYGAGRHVVDVRAPLIRALRAKGFAFVGNQLAGDPCPGITKQLVLEFSFQGRRETIRVPEGGTVEFPSSGRAG